MALLARKTKHQKVLKEITDMVPIFTPDMVHLQMKKRCLIFVHDDMMSGRNNSDLIVETSISGRWPLANVYTEDKFFFWKKDLGEHSYPVALDKDVTGFYHGNAEDKAPARIWGELYAIRPSQFILLDNERENGVQFIRREISVRLPFINGASKFPDITTIHNVWMYIGVHEYWDDQLAGIHSSTPIDKVQDKRAWLMDHYRYK